MILHIVKYSEKGYRKDQVPKILGTIEMARDMYRVLCVAPIGNIYRLEAEMSMLCKVWEQVGHLKPMSKYVPHDGDDCAMKQCHIKSNTDEISFAIVDQTQTLCWVQPKLGYWHI